MAFNYVQMGFLWGYLRKLLPLEQQWDVVRRISPKLVTNSDSFLIPRNRRLTMDIHRDKGKRTGLTRKGVIITSANSITSMGGSTIKPSNNAPSRSRHWRHVRPQIYVTHAEDGWHRLHKTLIIELERRFLVQRNSADGMVVSRRTRFMSLGISWGIKWLCKCLHFL